MAATSIVRSKPHSDQARWVVIYPSYINSKKTTGEGRKINKELAVENPTCKEILDIVQAGGFPCAGERKMYPREPERDNMMLQGRIRVQIKKDDGTPLNEEVPNRQALYIYVAKTIPTLKCRQPGYVESAPTSSGAGGKKNKKKK